MEGWGRAFEILSQMSPPPHSPRPQDSFQTRRMMSGSCAQAMVKGPKSTLQ